MGSTPLSLESGPRRDWGDPFVRTLREGIDAQLFALDEQLRYVTFNLAHASQMEAGCGVRPSERAPILALISDTDTRSRVEAALKRALDGERHTTLEWWRPGLGEPRLIDAMYLPVHTERGEVIGVAVVMRDRTSPSEGEAAFRHLEQRYRSLLRALGDGIVVIGEHGRIIESNEAFATLVGESMPLLPGMHFMSWHPGPRPEQILGGFHAALEHPTRFETTLRRRDETTVPIEVASSPVTIDGLRCVLCAVRDIRRRREADRALADRTARLSAIVRHAPVGIGVADLRTGRLVEANPAMLSMYGRSLEEIGDTPLNAFTHPEERPAERERFAELRDGRREQYTIRKRYVHPDGGVVPAELKVLRLPDEPDRPPLALGIGTDLRTLAEAERSLRDSEERYRLLADNAQDVIYRVRVRPALAVEYISPRVTELIGHEPAEFHRDPTLPFRLVVAEDHAPLRAMLGGETGVDGTRRLRWRRPDGRVVWMEHRSTPRLGPDGILEVIEGIARDVSQQVEREHQLRLIERVLQQMVEVSIITDRSGRIVMVNDAFERVTGYTRAEAIGATPRLLQSGRQDAAFYGRMWRTLAAGEVFASTLTNRRKDGSLYDAELVISPVRDPDGTISHYVGIQRDVTQELVREAQLRQAQKMEAMGQVTGGIAHDFNNLLTVILTLGNLIEDELPRDGEAYGALQDMVRSARQGTMMVRQLLAFGRQGNLAPGPIELGSLTRDFIEVLRRVIPETIRIESTVGEAPVVVADKAALEQILLNLANNARDAMPDGGTLSFVVGADMDAAAGGPFGTITVTDTGTGMNTEALQRCREPFFTTKPVGKGTGLGLSMVHGLMQQLGGRLEIVSTLGVGSSFTLCLPMVQEQRSAALESPVPAGAVPARIQARVLMAEDNDALRRVATRLLKRAGCEVVAAEDGDVAWAAWQGASTPFDIVLTDAVMPRLTGVELIDRIRATDRTVPIILMSGYNAEDISRLPPEVRILPKPWTGDSLLLVLTEALQVRRP